MACKSFKEALYCTNVNNCNINLIQNSPAVKKVCGPKKATVKKICEIQGGGQEMAVMVG